MNKRFETFIIALDEWFEDHQDAVDTIKAMMLGYNIASDVALFRKCLLAIREGNTRRAAYYAFFLGIAANAYLRMIRDYLQRDNEEDDDEGNDDEDEPEDDGPPGGLSKEMVVKLASEFLERGRQSTSSS